MRALCEKVHVFVDGELSPAERELFFDHMEACPRCQRDVEAILSLKALAETARAPAAAATRATG